MSSQDRNLTIIEHVRASAGVVQVTSLASLGWTSHQIRHCVESGGLVRVRRGWLAVPDAAREVVAAVRVGGTLTAASVAKRHGLWTMHDSQLHVRVPSHAGRLRAPARTSMPLEPRRHNVCVHYSADADRAAFEDPLPRALAEMLVCGEPAHAIVAIDSALEKKLLRQSEVVSMRQFVPAQGLQHLDHVDGKSQSGLETLVRLALVSGRVGHRSQVKISGVGRVDLLVGERLVLELDGKEHHMGENFESDRERDFALTLRGYLVVRLSYTMVLHSWPRIEAGLVELIRRGEHRWGKSRRAVAFRESALLQDQELLDRLFEATST